MTWHRFAPSSDDDHTCSEYDCGVIVADEALHLVSVDCPVPSCEDPGNRGPCVIVLAEDGPVCSYCDRRADLGNPSEEDDETA